MPTVLLTGAADPGGSRLEKFLWERDNITLRVLVRNVKKRSAKTIHHAEVFAGESFHATSLQQAFAGTGTAINLVHAMYAGHGCSQLDQTSAELLRVYQPARFSPLSAAWEAIMVGPPPIISGTLRGRIDQLLNQQEDPPLAPPKKAAGPE